MLLQETIFYLEMLAADQLQPAPAPADPPLLERVDPPQPELNRELYATVGRDWLWSDRLPWTRDEWFASLTRPGHETWLAKGDGETVGYFELQPDRDGGIELEYFGILPQFTGQRLGGWMLTRMIELAWERTSRRVWLHTSSYDHPAAIKNYQARGFRLYDQVTEAKEYPDDAFERWRQRNG